ncbi:MAG: hypothetical protein LUC95_01245 [Lachnospiraceae bacterium]|nr:hypothetical protein [Lachnospiraceae bacterium]
MFDEIAAHYYNCNFGSMPKADMELLMFRFYLDKLMSHDSDSDGAIDYKNCSDYKISKELGITQQRVRNLKIKKQLIYPVEFSWKDAFAYLTKNARFDKTTNKVVISIPDPNLYLEIQNYLEDSGAYIEKQLNSKLLVIRAEYYIDLVIGLEEPDSRKKVIRELKKFFRENDKDEVFDENEIGKSIMNAALDVTTLAANLSSLLSPANAIGTALVGLLKKS